MCDTSSREGVFIYFNYYIRVTLRLHAAVSSTFLSRQVQKPHITCPDDKVKTKETTLIITLAALLFPVLFPWFSLLLCFQFTSLSSSSSSCLISPRPHPNSLSFPSPSSSLIPSKSSGEQTGMIYRLQDA